MAPLNTPRPVVERLNAEVSKVLERPETRDAQARMGAQPMAMNVEAFADFLRADIARQADWIRMARITAG